MWSRFEPTSISFICRYPMTVIVLDLVVKIKARVDFKIKPAALLKSQESMALGGRALHCLYLQSWFIRIFPAALWHIAAQCESQQTYVFDEKQLAQQAELKQHPAPTCPRKSLPDSPEESRWVSHLGRALRQSCGKRQDLIEDSAEAV